jgi:prolyl 4-hydroxylase
MNERLSVDGSKHPNFIGCWMLEDPSICDTLIDVFERNKDLQEPGGYGQDDISDAFKKSTDIHISPRDLHNENFHGVAAYIEQLKLCYADYLDQWDFIKTFMPTAHIGSFNIQKYNEGGHFAGLHSERTGLNFLYRTLVWMTYLNDVAEGGETEFPMYGLNIKPEKGKTIIWPAEWTHAHLGGVVTKGNKYIITGWMHYPDDA